MAKTRYFILGEKASSFSDGLTGLSISNSNVGSTDSRLFKTSEVCKVAIQNGHIKEITETEAKKLMKENGQDDAKESIAKQERLRVYRENKLLQAADEEFERIEESIKKTTAVKTPDEEEEDEEEDDDGDDDEEEPTRADLIKKIQGSDQIQASDKKGLTTKKLEDLKTLAATIK